MVSVLPAEVAAQAHQLTALKTRSADLDCQMTGTDGRADLLQHAWPYRRRHGCWRGRGGRRRTAGKPRLAHGHSYPGAHDAARGPGAAQLPLDKVDRAE